MKKVVFLICSLFIVLSSFGVSAAKEAWQKDANGSKDHPLLTRMPNFYIHDYQDKEFERFEFPVKDSKPVAVEGHYYYIEYNLESGVADPGPTKINRNIQNALVKIGGKLVLNEDAWSTSTVVLTKGNKETWVHVKAWPALYRLWIVEKAAMEQEVVADAAAMGNDIQSAGHAAVYGIHFDTGKSTIKPESDAAISEIAKLLKNNGSMKIYVVGHTDNVGSFDSNMKLSRDRADEVMKTLVSKHNIAAARLKAVGVGQAAPVASNRTEDGKAKNRRVELVEQ